MKIVTSEQMRRIEQDCAGVGLTAHELMENAGKAVAEEVRQILGNNSQQHVLVLIGPGNNGGDGLVAARYLYDWGVKVSIYLCSQRQQDDSNLEHVQKRGVTCVDISQDENLGKLDGLLSSAACIVDALLGTGKARPLQGVFKKVLSRVSVTKEKDKGLRIIAVDLPSGLSADSGAVDPACLFADNTITLGLPKTGLFRFPGAERVGKLSIAAIGIDSSLAESVNAELITGEWARNVLPERPLDANKGSFGKVLVAAGSINYIGAAYLACSGAMRVGAGLVTLATAASLQSVVAARLSEATYLPLPESGFGIISSEAAELITRQFSQYDVLLIGCGLGQSPSTIEFISSVLFSKGLPGLVIDADALNALSGTPNWWKRLADNAILTPHPGEMARLTGLTVEEVQSDRAGVAQKFAAEWRKTIVLKGAFTVVAAPDGGYRMSPVANPGLASAGTGDVLSGVIAGMVAQGLPLFDAAALGVYLHGKAGDMVKEIIGDAGMIATDLLSALPLAIKELKN